MTVVTVNKVQDIYDTPVYSSTDSDKDLLLLMNQYLIDKVSYDFVYY